ncbi:MAG: hypothetical protein A2174_03675 [Candidatus Portnoybacteria bacterium RBG_13_41_18]|uniref:5'-3' exonuclease alpha-helical arch N-terminal domain-containing protein n=1 Tax=Candidatus Portnoybacteria bacterium RBG_13_41_18 TaxID=1801991 RepID=A0A1G2F4N1_9BACT|nr:MAG: hypothetical protein A2174_03675 [Candidatus Portnoybacteria bacterium RBG_13_41_18]
MKINKFNFRFLILQMIDKKEKILLLIDSHALIHRAFHALPPLTTKKGERVNLVYVNLSWRTVLRKDAIMRLCQ